MFRRTFPVLMILALAGLAQADTVTNSGVIDGSDPTFDNPDTVATTLTNFDTIEFTVDADGAYAVLGFYPGDVATDMNMDGYLLLEDGGMFVASDDDYTVGGITELGSFDAACVGQNCSGFVAALTAGTTYTLTQTTFTDTANAFGLPSGPYDQTLTGPGTITIVPEPTSNVLSFSVLFGLASMALRRRRS